MVDFALSEEMQMVRETARDFAWSRIYPTIEEDEEAHRFRPEIVREMGELGFFGTLIDEQYGGNPELGMMAAVLMSEETARVSASWGLPFNMQMIGSALTIQNFGTDAQKEKYIPQLVSGEKLGYFAITEPNSGSDVASMGTTALKKGDRYVLNGQKMWISNAQVGDYGITFAKTDPNADKPHRGLSAFITETKDAKGVEAKAIESKFGLFCAPTGEFAFSDYEVPEENLLGKEGDGFKICMTLLGNTRLSCAARAVGVSRACLEDSTKYAKERTQFGKPIASFQMIQEQLAEMWLEHAAAELLVWKAAWNYDRIKREGLKERNTIAVSTAKLYSATAAMRSATLAMKIFGSYGFSTEYPAARYLRDAASYAVVEGTSNIQTTIIARWVIDEMQITGPKA
ncbi:MAG: acyl-CoA dehydrogenase [Planctomycetota bacterium]|nr:MAG: acyl-CoA dehydrogenase [Planctomycetota bacterium]